MFTRSMALGVASAMLLPAVARPQAEDLMTVSGVSIPETDVYRIQSRQVGREFEIWVASPVPGLMGPLPDAFDVVYVLDANLFFGTVVETTRLMYQLFGELPPLLVVGIAYGTSDLSVQSQLRTRDYTPTVEEEFAGSPTAPGREPVLPDGKRMGGADTFLSFLKNEVQPLIAAHYPVEKARSTLLGSSLGGLLALYALMTQPDLFDGYVVASPAIWWDNNLLFDLETKLADRSDDLATRVFLGVGALEEGQGMPWMERFQMVTNVRALEQRLNARHYPSLELTVQVFENETHTSVVPAVVTRGLRQLYGR